MEFTKDRTKNMIEMVLKASKTDFALEEAKKKLQELTKEENLEILTQVFNILDRERNGQTYSKQDKSFFVDETIRSFSFWKENLSPSDLAVIRAAPIERINLPTRIYNQICKYSQNSKKYKTIGDLLDMNAEELSSLQQIGVKSIIGMANAVRDHILEFTS